MNDYWHEGYGAGLSGCTWAETTLGRFFRPWERKALADGWRVGLEELASYTADQESGVPMWDEIPV